MDTNRLIAIDELEVGDEILTCLSNRFRYYKILRKPKQNPKTGRWSGVKCSMCEDSRKVIRYAGTAWECTRTIITHIPAPDNHNTERTVRDLSYRDMWLMKRIKI